MKNEEIWNDLVAKAAYDAMRALKNADHLLPPDDEEPPLVQSVVFISAVLLRMTTSFLLMVSEHGMGEVSVDKAAEGYTEMLRDFVRQSANRPELIKSIQEGLNRGRSH